MDTKLKADIAENAALTELLKRGHRVLKPVGDRLQYDLCVEKEGRLIKIQIKSAWRRGGVYIVDSRRTKTNRRRMRRSHYQIQDFDFAILYIQDLHVFYIMPNKTFCSYRSEITLAEENSRQRKPQSFRFREAWDLLQL